MLGIYSQQEPVRIVGIDPGSDTLGVSVLDVHLDTNRIELADITYITPTRNAISAPALSLDRLKITYKNKKVLISPKDKPQFYREIQLRNPNIIIVE